MIQYQTYDVTNLLQAENHMAIIVGRGWYSGRFGFAAQVGDGGFFGDEFMTIAELHVMYEDGDEEVIKTDDSWNVTRSKITFSNLYDGEHRDDILAKTQPEAVYYTMPKGKLTARMSIPVITHEELPAKELIHTPAGEQVFDLGQNMAGGFRLWVDVAEGTRVHIQTGEILVDGNFYNGNLRTAQSEYIYISDGVPKFVEPVFTYYGYRYAKVEGIEKLRKVYCILQKVSVRCTQRAKDQSRSCAGGSAPCWRGGRLLSVERLRYDHPLDPVPLQRR